MCVCVQLSKRIAVLHLSGISSRKREPIREKALKVHVSNWRYRQLMKIAPLDDANGTVNGAWNSKLRERKKKRNGKILPSDVGTVTRCSRMEFRVSCSAKIARVNTQKRREIRSKWVPANERGGCCYP